jgi:DNA-binding CsgD family transcriptional regulator
MKNLLILLLILFFRLNDAAIAQNVVYDLPTDFEELSIDKGVKILTDVSQRCRVEDMILGKSDCQLRFSNNRIINTGHGKHQSWISFQLNSGNQQEAWLQLDYALLNELNVYLVESNQIVQRYEGFSPEIPKVKRPFSRYDFVFKLNLEKNKQYSIFINHKVSYGHIPLGIKLWSSKALESYTITEGQWVGVFFGILILILVVSLFIGYFLDIRLFLLFGFNVFALIISFMFLNGSLFQFIPYRFFVNQFYDFSIIFYYLSFIIHIFFLRGFTKIHVSQNPIVSPFYKVFLRYIVVIFGFTLFIPILNQYLPYWFFYYLGWFNLLMFIMIVALFTYAIYKSYVHSSFTKTYFKICVFGLTIFFITFLNDLNIINVSIYFKYSYYAAMVLIILSLLIGMIYEVKYYFKTVKTNQFMPERNNEIQLFHESKLTKDEIFKPKILTKRETEILKAFANGFSNSEIADAMFISSHTVRTHLKNIYQKLNINSKVEAVRWVMENEG